MLKGHRNHGCSVFLLLRGDLSGGRHSSAVLAGMAEISRLDAAEISLILSVGVWMRAFASPLIAHFADRSGAHKKIIMISAGAA